MVSERRWRRTVFLEMPNRLAISLNGICSRICQRRIMPSNATSITPIPRLNVMSRIVSYTWVRFVCQASIVKGA